MNTVHYTPFMNTIHLRRTIMKTREEMMGQMAIPKLLRQLALPAIIGMLITAIYNVVDTLFVSVLGTEAVGAVSIVYPLFMFLSAIGLMYGVGSGSFISRLLGSGDKKQANRVASTTLISSLASAIVLGILLFIGIKPILGLFGATDTIMPHALSYAKFLLTGSVFTILNMTMNNILRAEGSAKYSMIALMIGAILNILLDPLFIFYFDMGVSGAAIATVLSQGISTLVLLSFFLKKKSLLHFSIHHFKPSKSLYSELFKIGSPTFFRQFLLSFSIGLINNAAAPYGDSAIAAVGITLRVFSIVSMVIFGYSQGFQPVAGFNYGAKKIKRLQEAIRISLLWTTIFCSISSLVYILCAPQIMSLFSKDPHVIAFGIQIIRAFMIVFPLFGFQTIYAVLFQALGRGKEAAFLSLARQGLFLIPAILILPNLFGMTGIILAQPLADLLTVILTIFFAVSINSEIKRDLEIAM